MSWIVGALVFWVLAWALNVRLVGSGMSKTRAGQLAVAVLFGATILVLWEGLVRGIGVSPIILPPPSAIAAKIATSLPILWADFVQTFLKGALPGFAMGCGAAVLTAIAIDRSPFLQRGLLPIGNFVAALPIVVRV
jgi:NitT/TauT family transport system permease protein